MNDSDQLLVTDTGLWTLDALISCLIGAVLAALGTLALLICAAALILLVFAEAAWKGAEKLIAFLMVRQKLVRKDE